MPSTDSTIAKRTSELPSTCETKISPSLNNIFFTPGLSLLASVMSTHFWHNISNQLVSGLILIEYVFVR